uniref:Uncharacterized protein n=1 Tax=uncultured bacterium A1Q1_fos_1877 TaxID=1256555 RepID=L7VXP2_9BACT|nr:hypothetical protein [uncultured bacterium A1Q1_fos_1877]
MDGFTLTDGVDVSANIMNQLQHVVVPQMDTVLIGHQLLKPSEVFDGRKLANLFRQMPCDSMTTTANDGIRGSLPLTTLAASITSSFKAEFSAETHDADSTPAHILHGLSTTEWPPQGLSKFGETLFENRLPHTVFEPFCLLLAVKRFP